MDKGAAPIARRWIENQSGERWELYGDCLDVIRWAITTARAKKLELSKDPFGLPLNPKSESILAIRTAWHKLLENADTVEKLQREGVDIRNPQSIISGALILVTWLTPRKAPSSEKIQ